MDGIQLEVSTSDSSDDGMLMAAAPGPVQSGPYESEVARTYAEEGRCLADAFLATPWVPGSYLKKPNLPHTSLLDALKNTDRTAWICQLEETQPVARRVIGRRLGAHTSAALIERLFSTAKQVWNEALSSTGVGKFERKAILRKTKNVWPMLKGLVQEAAGAKV